MLVAELVDRYLLHAERTGALGPVALASRKTFLGCLVEKFGQLSVEDCRPWMLTDWIDDQPRWRSSATRKAKADQVNSCFNWGVAQGRIAQNPFKGVAYPDGPPRPPLLDADFARLVAVANRAAGRAMRFLRLTGCRLGELCELCWSGIDLVRGSALVERHKSRRRTGKAKLFALTAEAEAVVREALQEARVRQGAQQVAPESRVFTNCYGRPWRPNALIHYLLRLKARHGLEIEASLHGLRHQFGTEAVKNGAPIKLVSLQLGHASVVTTERYYVHLSGDPDAIRQAAELGSPRA